MRENGGGDGNRITQIVFTNTGSTLCALEGAPGVSVVGHGDGSQLGKPAGRATSGGTVVRIKPGSAAVASLTRIYLDSRTTSFNTASGGTTPCKVEHGDGYRILPAPFIRRDLRSSRRHLRMHKRFRLDERLNHSQPLADPGAGQSIGIAGSSFGKPSRYLHSAEEHSTGKACRSPFKTLAPRVRPPMSAMPSRAAS